MKRQYITQLNNFKMTPLGFITWGDDDQFCPPGEVLEFTDGVCISLLHTVKKLVESSGKSLSDFEFNMQLSQNGQTVAEHVFKTENINDIWLIADPAMSDEDGSFSALFVSEFAKCEAGKHNFTLKLFANGELLHEGELIYNSDGVNTAYKELISKFKDISGTRDEANKLYQQEYAQEQANQEREQDESTDFKIQVTNVDSGHTKYLVETNQRTLSETIHHRATKRLGCVAANDCIFRFPAVSDQH